MPTNLMPPDGGMHYTETNMEHLFPEPFNAVTAVLFLLIAIFWTVKIKGNFKQHVFLTYCLALLYVGGIGGTIYHSFRQWPIFIMMDWLPIMLLCVSAGIYFLVKRTKWYYALVIILGYFALQLSLRSYFTGNNEHLFINVNYALLALIVLLPLLSYLIYTKWQAAKWVGFALLAFVLALTFRVVDRWAWLSIGTHFLWHSFGAIATYCMFQYIYLTQQSTQVAPSK
ncbi:hypothetical protein [Pedobacter sp.]